MLVSNKRNKFWVNDLKNQEKEAEFIRSLDPLRVDTVIRKIHRLNETGDVGKIVALLYKHIPLPDMLEAFSVQESLAAMRDLGIFMGSIKRHGMEPVEEVPELDYILDVLSAKTDLPPRDTLLHYTQWNPTGKRMRTYTHYKDERELVKSVKISMGPLMESIYRLIDMYWTSPNSQEFEELCHSTKASFKSVIKGIVFAKRHVSPELFAKELRLYFDPIEIYSKDFIGPGAVEMPLFVYDYILWGSDVENEEYQDFSRTYVPFNLASVRDIYYNFVEKPSLVTKIVGKLVSNPTAQIIRSAKTLLELCKQEKSFRLPHKKLAEESYEASEERGTGSGGYSTTILDKILNANLSQIGKLSKAIEFSGL